MFSAPKYLTSSRKKSAEKNNCRNTGIIKHWKNHSRTGPLHKNNQLLVREQKKMCRKVSKFKYSGDSLCRNISLQKFWNPSPVIVLSSVKKRKWFYYKYYILLWHFNKWKGIMAISWLYIYIYIYILYNPIGSALCDRPFNFENAVAIKNAARISTHLYNICIFSRSMDPHSPFCRCSLEGSRWRDSCERLQLIIRIRVAPDLTQHTAHVAREWVGHSAAEELRRKHMKAFGKSICHS